MGVCCSNSNHQIQNYSELFLQEILFTHGLTKCNWDEISQRINRSKEKVIRICDIEQSSVYSQILYDSQFNDLYNESGDLTDLHKCILPKLEELPSHLIPDHPETNFYISVFSMICDNHKPRCVLRILETANLELNVRNFRSFLSLYLDQNLKYYPERILSVLKSMNLPVRINEFVITKQTLNDLQYMIDVYVHSDFKSNLERSLSLCIYKEIKFLNPDENLNLDEFPLSEHLVRKTQFEFQFLFNAVELRKYFYGNAIGL